jgi:hypothetical protein
MEFAVAIAGFSGITMAIQFRSGTIDEIASFRNKNLIAFSLSAAFGSTFPRAIAHLGADGSEIWAWSSTLFSIVCGLLVFLAYAGRGKMPVEDRSRLSRATWRFVIGGTTVAFAFQLANAAAYLGQPGPAPLYIGIIWLIIVAATMYYRLLFDMSRASDA